MFENYNLEKLKPELLDINTCDLTNDFVAISVEVDENGLCCHSGLVICYEEELSYFHYTAKDVVLEKLDIPLTQKAIFLKELNCIHPLEVESFLGHCEKLIEVGDSPVYGFIFNDSYYDSTTKESFLVNTYHDITTCVGFCIKVIRGFLYNHDEYLKLSDWNISTLQGTNQRLINYFNHEINNYSILHEVSIAQLISIDELKRITPTELLGSGFFENLPIIKASIDAILNRLISDIIELRTVA